MFRETAREVKIDHAELQNRPNQLDVSDVKVGNMSAHDPNDISAQPAKKLRWQNYINFTVVFNSLSAAFFCMTAYLLLSNQEWSATGRGAVSFLCAFSCALIGNLDRFESVKASLSGIEAKTREIEKAFDEARVALKEFHVLAELTGSFLIELMTGAGRFGGGPPDDNDKRRTRIIDALTTIGLDSDAIKRVNNSDGYWIQIDYSLGILSRIKKSATCSAELKAAAGDMLRRWNDENFRPTPQDFVQMLASSPHLDIHVDELIEDYKYYVEKSEHRRPDVWRVRHTWPR